MSAIAPKPAGPTAPVTRSRSRGILRSSLGQKILMAVTGVILSLFVLGHMIGNLQVFQGAEELDAYARLLRKEPALLWGARLTLLGAVGVHIWAFVSLTLLNWRARAEGYRKVHHKESSYASRSMIITGPLLLAFIVYHILHLTTGTVHPDFHEGTVYDNLVSGLSVVWVSGFYLLAMLALGFHLWHGVWSLFQTLGVGQARYDSLGRKVAMVFTLLVVLGFAAVPLGVLSGVIKPTTGAPQRGTELASPARTD